MMSFLSSCPSYSEYNEYNNNINSTKNNWTEEQDALLLTLVHKFDKKWKKVSDILTSKNPGQCSYRYSILNGKYERKYFSERDKSLFINAIKKYGLDWEQIAIVMKKFSIKVLQQKYEKMKNDGMIETMMSYGGDSTQNESNQSVSEKEEVMKEWKSNVKFNKRKIVNLFFYLTTIFKSVKTILNKHPNTSNNRFIKQEMHLEMEYIEQFYNISRQYKFSFQCIKDELVQKLLQCYNQMANLIELSKLYCIGITLN